MNLVRLATALAILLVISCGKSSNKTVLTWWQFWTNPEVRPTIEKMVTDFESANPDIDVQLGDLTWSDGHEKIAIALAAGNGPDVIELGSDWISEFAANGKLSDLTPDVATLKDSLQMWDPGIYQGRYYAVPWMLGTRVLFCNRSLIELAGYGPKTYPANWEDLLTLSKRITDLGDERYGFASNSAERHRLYKKFLPFFWSAGGRVFNDDQTATEFASDVGIRSLSYYVTLSENGIIDTQGRLEDYFADGKIGFAISGEWLVKRLIKIKPKFDWFVPRGVLRRSMSTRRWNLIPCCSKSRRSSRRSLSTRDRLPSIPNGCRSRKLSRRASSRLSMRRWAYSRRW